MDPLESHLSPRSSTSQTHSTFLLNLGDRRFDLVYYVSRDPSCHVIIAVYDSMRTTSHLLKPPDALLLPILLLI